MPNQLEAFRREFQRFAKISTVQSWYQVAQKFEAKHRMS
jgi:hypothetical protein